MATNNTVLNSKSGMMDDLLLKIDAINKLAKEMSMEMIQFYQGGNEVTFETLNKIPTHSEFTIAPGVVCVRYETEKQLLFHASVIFNPLAFLDSHKHDCFELVHVRKGTIKYNNKTYRKGQAFLIKPGIIHNMKSKDGCTLDVLFIRNV